MNVNAKGILSRMEPRSEFCDVCGGDSIHRVCPACQGRHDAVECYAFQYHQAEAIASNNRMGTEQKKAFATSIFNSAKKRVTGDIEESYKGDENTNYWNGFRDEHVKLKETTGYAESIYSKKNLTIFDILRYKNIGKHCGGCESFPCAIVDKEPFDKIKACTTLRR